VLVAVLVGAVIGAAVGVPLGVVDALLIGWVVAAATFAVWTWISIWPQDAAASEADARREDPSRPLADVTCLTAAVASLIAVAVVLVHAGNEQGAAKLLAIGLAVTSVVAAWLVIHTVFTLKYARHYYGVGGGISFNEDARPSYSDFAYLAFTIGMTFQVSDTDLQNNDIRRLALRHMLLSYLMGAVIVAVTINLVAGMTK
jgi:uncharacterized membrane protein